jgi:hypothetical protein
MNPWPAILKQVDEAAREAIANAKAGKSVGPSLPPKLRAAIDAWSYGKYGWTSPVNLMITAAWTKWIYPSQDVCKIWARDASNTPINGSYSIRSYDETITVTVVSKYDIYPNFCSRNSGMQGTRAIEKTRGATRLQSGVKIEQRVTFDLNLFVETMNLINSLKASEAKLAFQYYIELGSKIQIKRHADLKKLEAAALKASNDRLAPILRACSEIADPQFAKAVAATALELWAKHAPNIVDGKIRGTDGMMTGADARSREPGDLWVTVDEKPVIGCEVKDKSKTFGFEILRAVEERKAHNPSMHTYFLLGAGEVPVPEATCGDPEWGRQIESLRIRGLAVIPITIRDLFLLAQAFSGPLKQAVILLSKNLERTPGLKNTTVKQWTRIIS